MSDIRDRIAEIDDLHGEKVEVPEWDTSFDLCEMDGTDRAWILNIAYDAIQDTINLMDHCAEIIITSARDSKTGEKIFTREDTEMLKGKNGKILERLALKALKVSAITDDATSELKKD